MAYGLQFIPRTDPRPIHCPYEGACTDPYCSCSYCREIRERMERDAIRNRRTLASDEENRPRFLVEGRY